MEKKLAIWKQQAQTIKSPEHLEQLFNTFQCQLQSWTLKHTEMFSGSQQTQQQVDFPEHQRNDGQIPTEISKGGTVESTQTTQDGRNKILQEKNEKLQKWVSELQMKYDSKAAENLERNKEAEIEQLRKTSNEQRKQVKAKERENNEHLTRRAITDLCSEIRPTKIAENFKEIYDNQWVEAFEELIDQGYPEEPAIQILITTVDDSFQFTADMAKRRLEHLETSTQTSVMNTTQKIQKHVEPAALSEECSDLVKQLRKASAQTHVDEIQHGFVQTQLHKLYPPKKNETMINFYKECARVTWYMNVQMPPLSLAPKPARGSAFDTDMYALYTQSGTKVDYVVWPACLLHGNGPLLVKGVIQPLKQENMSRAQIALGKDSMKN
ncbi:uncharacterized protein [Argopecten irradians]|uniref:uncharacterized protein n=1 Tax=Argopecten irradians TaxID=31199 RepID=UPI003721E23A